MKKIGSRYKCLKHGTNVQDLKHRSTFSPITRRRQVGIRNWLRGFVELDETIQTIYALPGGTSDKASNFSGEISAGKLELGVFDWDFDSIN